MGRWWVAVVALMIGIGAGFVIARATEGVAPKRTVDVTRTFLNATEGQIGTWTTTAVRHSCAPDDVAMVRVTIVRVTSSAGRGVVQGASYTSAPKSYQCDAFMRQFKK